MSIFLSIIVQPYAEGEKGGMSEEQETGRTVAGGEGSEDGLRWRVHQLEKDKLELISLHNQEVHSLILSL